MSQPTDRARSLLRALDRNVQDADEALMRALKDLRKADERRAQRVDRLSQMPRLDCDKELAAMGIRGGLSELRERDTKARECNEVDLRNRERALNRAMGVYEGARRMAVDVGAIPFDEFPRWETE